MKCFQRAQTVFGVCLVLAGLVACGEAPQQSDQAAVPVPASEEAHGNGAVLATVNGSPITQADVELALARTFSQADRLSGDAPLRQKVLESLVASRALRQAAEQALPADRQQRIRARARAYEEELLVQAYLRDQVTPEPVTAAMVQRYYEAHPERFGGEPLYTLDWLRAPAGQDEAQRQALLKAVPQLRASEDWAGLQARWQQQYGVHVQQLQEASPGVLPEALANALAELAPGETSHVILVDGQLHLLRLQSVERQDPRPLAEVSDRIRQTLAPRQLKAAVKAVSERALQQADIQYQASEAAQ